MLAAGIATGRAVVVRELLECGVDPNPPPASGTSGVHLAAASLWGISQQQQDGRVESGGSFWGLSQQEGRVESGGSFCGALGAGCLPDSLEVISTPFQPHFNPISTPFQPHFTAILPLFDRHFTAI